MRAAPVTFCVRLAGLRFAVVPAPVTRARGVVARFAVVFRAAPLPASAPRRLAPVVARVRGLAARFFAAVWVVAAALRAPRFAPLVPVVLLVPAALRVRVLVVFGVIMVPSVFIARPRRGDIPPLGLRASSVGDDAAAFGKACAAISVWRRDRGARPGPRVNTAGKQA